MNRRRLALAPLMFVLAVPAQAQNTISTTPVDREVERLWQLGHEIRPRSEESLGRRVADIALALVGRPYELSPLGEGGGVDPDPRLRVDAFDCTTFVETVAAIALAESPAQVAAKLDELRYDGREPTFENRLHLIAAQWLPAWRRRGVLQGINLDGPRDFALRDRAAPSEGNGAQSSSVVLDITPDDLEHARSEWMSGRRLPALPWDHLPTGQFELPIVLLHEGAEVLSGLRDPLVLQVVRQPRQGRPWMVTHQALMVRKKVGERWVSRVVHASSVRGAVVEVTTDQFLAAQRAAQRWPVVGINVQIWGETQPRRVRHESKFEASAAAASDRDPR